MSHLVNGVKGRFVEMDLKVAAREGVPVSCGKGEAEARGWGSEI